MEPVQLFRPVAATLGFPDVAGLVHHLTEQAQGDEIEFAMVELGIGHGPQLPAVSAWTKEGSRTRVRLLGYVVIRPPAGVFPPATGIVDPTRRHRAQPALEAVTRALGRA